MRGALKSMTSPDVDLVSYRAEPPDPFRFLVEAEIGGNSSEGADLFQFQVCSPAWLATHSQDGPVILHGFILMHRYTYEELQQTIQKLAWRFEADTWEEIAFKISKYALREFEDYKDE